MDLERIKGLIATDLEIVEETIAEVLASESEPVRRLVAHVSHFAGKRLRPALILLVAKALGRLNKDHVKLAAVVELIHTATLVHDDVLDGASMRRRVESVNFLHGNHVSVLLGDMIYARAFSLSLTLSDMKAARSLSRVTQTICQGEIEQIFSRNDFDLCEERYFAIIGAKTASLYRAACELSALYSGASGEAASSLGRSGYCLGIAFQIVDDCLDIIGEESVVGKSLGTDTKSGKMTLPLIHLASTLAGEDRERLKEIFLSREIEDKNRAIMDSFDFEESVTYAFKAAERHIREALGELDLLPETPARNALKEAARFVLVRKV